MRTGHRGWRAPPSGGTTRCWLPISQPCFTDGGNAAEIVATALKNCVSDGYITAGEMERFANEAKAAVEDGW